MLPNLMNALEQHLVKSLPEYVALFGLFMVAVVASMRHPDIIDRWLGAWQPVSPWARWHTKAWQKLRDLASLLYGWFYDSTQAFLASRNPPPPRVPTSGSSLTVVAETHTETPTPKA